MLAKCAYCNNDAWQECEKCGMLFCRQHGDQYGTKQNPEFVCNRCNEGWDEEYFEIWNEDRNDYLP